MIFIMQKKCSSDVWNKTTLIILLLNNILYCFDAIGDPQSTVSYLNDFLELNPYCEIAWHHLGKQYAKR